MMRTMLRFVVLVSLLSVGISHAGPIVQDQYCWGYRIDWYGPLGQTFTAEDPHVTIGFGTGGSTDFDISLYEGVGLTGSLLRTEAAALGLPVGEHGASWVDADFTGLTLTPGQMYTAIITTDDVGGGISAYTLSDALYPGGSMILQGDIWACDSVFRVLPVATVPAPGAAGLVALGVATAAWFRKRRNR